MAPFSLWIALGTGLGMALAFFRAGETWVRFVFAASLWVLLGALAAGRAVFVALTWSYFSLHSIEIPQVWLGGLSGPGALVGGIMVAAAIAAFWRINFGLLADRLYPLAGSLAAAVWMACWFLGEAYGLLAPAPLGLPSLESAGETNLRIPVQVGGALISLGLLWLADSARGRLKPGLAASICLGGLGLELLVFSFLRADTARSWFGIRLDAWAGLAIFAGFLAYSAIVAVIPVSRQARLTNREAVMTKGESI